MFDKIKKWYKQGLWSEPMVRTAVEKGIITDEQCAVILEQAE